MQKQIRVQSWGHGEWLQCHTMPYFPSWKLTGEETMDSIDSLIGLTILANGCFLKWQGPKKHPPQAICHFWGTHKLIPDHFDGFPDEL